MKTLALIALLGLIGCGEIVEGPAPEATGGSQMSGMGGIGGELGPALPECNLAGGVVDMPTPCPGPGNTSAHDSIGRVCAIFCSSSAGVGLIDCRTDYMGVPVHCLAGVACNDCR